jgi:MFS family permease
MVSSVGFLASGLLSLPAGFLLRYMNRKTMLVAGLTLIGLGLGGYGLMTTYAAVVLCQVVWGCGMAMVLSSETQLLFEYCRTRGEERKAYSWMFASYMLFNGTGMLLGGLLPRWLGGATTVYQYSFFVAAFMLLACAALRLLTLPPSRSGRTVAPAGDGEAANTREPSVAGGVRNASAARTVPEPALRSPFYVPRPWNMLWTLTFMMFIGGLLQGLINPFWNVILKFRLDLGDSAISLALTVANVFIFLGAILTPRLSEIMGVHRAILSIHAANAAVALLMALVLPAAAFLLLLFVREALFVMYTNLINSEAMSAVPDEHRNLFAVMRTISRNAGTAVASMAAGWILASANYALPFLISAAVLAVGFVCYVRWMKPFLDERELEREGEAAEQSG